MPHRPSLNVSGDLRRSRSRSSSEDSSDSSTSPVSTRRAPKAPPLRRSPPPPPPAPLPPPQAPSPPRPRLLSFATASMIGLRPANEDTLIVVNNFAATPAISYDYFAVFDGHGGSAVSTKLRDRLHVRLATEVSRRRSAGEEETVEMWQQSLLTSFSTMDTELINECMSMPKGTVGSTAVVAILGPNWLMIANCGDSRAILSRKGNNHAVALSFDHKPNRPDETRRVEALGGIVVNLDCPRVSGMLATSRAFGDYLLKPYVTSEPEITIIDLTEDDEFFMMASDGFWDAVKSDEAIAFARYYLQMYVDGVYPGYIDTLAASRTAYSLAGVALGLGSYDNVTVIVAQLNHMMLGNYSG